jgi:thiamine-phosphate pyrophosphorylase
VPPAAPRLYIITDRRATNGRPLVDVVRAALAGATPGAVAVQLREKDLEGRALMALARELRAVTRDADAALWINDRLDVALAVGADGVHLPGHGLSPSDVARIAPGLPVAVSTHGRGDVEAARREPNVAFAVFGPIWDTPSKSVYGPPPGLDELRAAVSIGLPLIALGGVNSENAAACRAAGAAGVACVRAVGEAFDPAAAVRAFLRVG